MRIDRKKGIDRIKITHNWKLLIVILILIGLLVYLIYLGFRETGNSEESECVVDEDCVPATCCHPSECVSVYNAPDCSSALCSQVCSGPLDCNAGYCSCVNGKCNVVEKD